jgi:hypothetical protein
MAGSRYENNEEQKLNDGRRVYRSKIYPNIPLQDTDIYVVTQEGDRLDQLSSEYYDNSSYWWIISTANNIHDASLSVPPGTILRIPIDYLNIANNFKNY